MMDPNEYLKSLLFYYAPKVQEGLGMANIAAQHGLGMITQDAQRAADILGDPRMAGIGLGPEAAIFSKGLGLLGALRASGGSREALNPLLMQAWKRGEELTAMQEAVRQNPEVFGFKTPSEWRHSLSKDDLWSMWLHSNTTRDLANAELKRQGVLERTVMPSEAEMQMLQSREMFPPGEQYSNYALGLDRLKGARKRQQE